MDQKKVGYVLQPIGEGSTISNSIKCKLPPDQKPCFIFAKRRELIICEIVESGLKPLKKVPFPSTIACLRLITSKSLGKPNGSDLIIVYFQNHSFLVLSDPEHVKFQYTPDEVDIEDLPFFVCEAHSLSPIILSQNHSGHLLYWSLLDNPNTVYNIACSDQQIIDMKFLSHQSIRLSILYDTNAGSRHIMTYTFNKRLLVLEEVSRLCVRQLVDPSSAFIIPCSNSDHSKPVFLVIGTENITIVIKNSASEIIETPFEGYAPKCYCELGGWSSIVATADGSLFGLSYEDKLNTFKIGVVPIVPTSITKIDGNVFFFGSSNGNSLFAQITNTDIQILDTVDQFTPVNSFSNFCENFGSIFLTQGNERCSSLSTLKTGAVFNKEVEIHIPFIDQIFSANGNYLILSMHNGRSACLDYSTLSDALVSTAKSNDALNRFISNEKTANVIERNNDSFFQVCQRTIRIVGKDTNGASITYDDDILHSTTDGENLLLLFNDSAEVVSMDLEPIVQVHFAIPRAYVAALYKGMIAVAFTSGDIQLHSTTELLKSTSIENDELVKNVTFVVNKEEIVLVAFCESGKIIRLELPELQEIGRISVGYHIRNVIEVREKLQRMNKKLSPPLFVNGSSPILLYSHGSYISVVLNENNCNSVCSIDDEKYAISTDSDLFLGTIHQNDTYSITQKYCISQPLHFSIHKKPLALFVSFETRNSFSITAFALPSFSETFTLTLDADEEITSIYYHEALNMTFFGTATHSNGMLYCVKEILSEFKIVKKMEIEGSVFTLTSSKPRNLIVGGSCKLFIFDVESTFSGLLKIEQKQMIENDVVPCSVSTLGPFIIYFGFNKMITVYHEKKDGTFEKYDENIIRTPLHFGFLGKIISSNMAQNCLTCHVFTIDMNNKLTISRFKFQDDAITLNPLTTYQIESAVSAFHPIRDGFSLISTRNGALFALMEYDRNMVSLLRVVALEISKKLPIVPNESKILDASILSFYENMPEDVQMSIAEVVEKNPNEIIDYIVTLKHTMSRLCSTL